MNGRGVSRRGLLLRSAAATALAPAAAAGQDPRVPLSRVMSVRPQNGPVRTAPAGNVTISTLYNLESAPSWIRLNYAADRVAGSIDGAAIAISSAVHDGFTPVDAEGRPDNSLWQRVTFNSDGEDSQPARQTGQPLYRLDVPRRDAPVIGYSDWMPVASLPRSDGRYGFLALVRTWSRGGTFRTASAAFQVLANKENGRDFVTGVAEGDGTVPPWRFAGERGVVTACYGLQYVSRQPGATVVGIGDSIMLPPESMAYGMRACVLVSRPDLPVTYVNEGYLGRRSADYLANGARDIVALRPQVALVQTFNGNDPRTRAATDSGFDGAMKLADLARGKQCVPILVTAAPEPQIDAAAETLRQDSINRTRGMALKGFLVLDLDAVWGVGAAPNTWKPGYARDRWHPSDSGTQAAAEALAPLLRQVLGRT